MDYQDRLVDELIPYVNNARTHSEEKVTQLASSIKEFGFLNPIIIDQDNGVIAGHGRLMAAKKLGLESVPVLLVDHLTEAQKKAYVLADNQLGLNSGWDYDLLKVEVEGLQELDFDVGLVGFGDSLDDIFIDQILSMDEEQKDEPKESPKENKKSDDGYSSFEIVMEHENKLRLLKALNNIKEENNIETLEQAVMIMVEPYA